MDKPKKIIILNILDILNRYTDCEHKLSQKEIQNILKNEYDMKVERKAIRRNLMTLYDCGYPIEFETKKREVLNKETGEYEDNSIYYDFYIEHEFDDTELRLLIDSIVFSSHIPQGDKKRLIGKLESLSNKYFTSRMKHVATAKSKASSTNNIFYTLEILDEAISKGEQVVFHYDEYGTDKKLHHRKNSAGEPREYLINPYQIAATNGRYYLVCNYDKYDQVSNYRLDRISDIRRVEGSKAKPITSLPGMEKGLDLTKHMSEHISMFTEKPVWVKFRAQKYNLNDIIDFFGTDVRFVEETEETVTVSVKISEKDMELWALQFATQVTVLEPQSLAEKCKENIKIAMQRYEEI
ncbi:MAG: WYL domain-containing protein [Clostridia bacterium]|nr:WYL domain-containing protein [Clostridia bacterium]